MQCPAASTLPVGQGGQGPRRKGAVSPASSVRGRDLLGFQSQLVLGFDCVLGFFLSASCSRPVPAGTGLALEANVEGSRDRVGAPS